MILFKACPRCGGDVDTSYHEDIHCVQCAYRPKVVYPGPRVIDDRIDDKTDAAQSAGPEASAQQERAIDVGTAQEAMVCPKCGSQRAIILDKLRPGDNICYRCWSCGHIFSPRAGTSPADPSVALP